MNALDILRQTQFELEKPGYHECKDRVLSMIDGARIFLSPPRGRTPEAHKDVTDACQAAQCELAKTVLCKGSDYTIEEPDAYLLLTSLGEIPKNRYDDILKRTIRRLERLPVVELEPAE